MPRGLFGPQVSSRHPKACGGGAADVCDGDVGCSPRRGVMEGQVVGGVPQAV